MIEDHLHSLRESGYAKTTVAITESWLLQFAGFCGERDPLELSEADLVAWHKELTWTPGPSGKLYSPSTVNQAVGAVRRFYRWAVKEGKLSANPTVRLVTPAAERVKPRRVFSVQEQRKLLACPDPGTPYGIRDRAILALLFETGISMGAVSRIDRAHLQFDTGALLTRGRTQRIHSLSEALLADIDRYLREARPLLVRHVDQALFLNSKGERMTEPSVRAVLKRHRTLCGL